MTEQKPIIPLGTRTPDGVVQMVGFTVGERYYWLLNRGAVAMLPADVVEPRYREACRVAEGMK